MPLPRWLRSLTVHKHSQTGGPPPPGGEGWGGGLRPTFQPLPTPNPTPLGGGEVSPTTDNSHRIHIAANDPAFPAKREAAIAIICQAITDIATPMGYTRKGTTWSRTTDCGRSAIHLQRSRYGFAATINLRFLTPDGASPQGGVWADDNDISLQHFYQQAKGEHPENATLTYLDVVQSRNCLMQPMQILTSRALPWLDAHHTRQTPPTIIGYLPS